MIAVLAVTIPGRQEGAGKWHHHDVRAAEGGERGEEERDPRPQGHPRQGEREDPAGAGHCVTLTVILYFLSSISRLIPDNCFPELAVSFVCLLTESFQIAITNKVDSGLADLEERLVSAHFPFTEHCTLYTTYYSL